MAERAQKVVIRDGAARLFRSRWGAQSCLGVLGQGEAGLFEDLKSSEATEEWWDNSFCEGGYLVNFDAQTILVYSWDDAIVKETKPAISAAWPGWKVVEVSEGIKEFRAHVSQHGPDAA